MADFKAPSTRSVTRSQDRKRRVVASQEEENDAGFRFTRRSKRLREKDQEHAKTSDVKSEQSNSDNKNTVKEAKRRRSSFIRGRKIRSPLEVCQSDRLAAVQGLYKEIPTDLSPDERLLQLFDKSLLLMCENAKDKKYMNIPNFPEKVVEVVEHLRTILKNSDFAKRATEPTNKMDEKVIIPNPKAQQLEEYAKKSQETTERVLKEDKEWEEILGKYQNDNDSMESEVMESYDKINKDSLSVEQREFLDSIQPREGMFENLDRLKNESILMIDKIVSTASTVKALNDAAERYLEKNAEELIESPSTSTCTTPRHLIHAITKDSEDPS